MPFASQDDPETNPRSGHVEAPDPQLRAVERLVRSIVESFVTDKRCVRVLSRPDQRGMTVCLIVSPADLRDLLGGGGRMAESIRTIVHSAGMRLQRCISLRIESE